MFELGVFDKKTDELVISYELDVSSDDVSQIVGFSLQGNCADLSMEQVKNLERICGSDFQINLEQHCVEICEIA